MASPVFYLLLLSVLLLGGGFFALGYFLGGRYRGTHERIALFAVAVMLALPGLLFTLYYLHWFDNAIWFYRFRAWPGMEFTACGLGFAAGLTASLFKGKKYFSWPFVLILLCIWLGVPYLKPLIASISAKRWNDLWRDDVCLQSTPSSCGAASAASILRKFGVEATERQIARECFTSRSGTENWYLARMFRKRGFRIDYRIDHGFPADLQLPAIAGVLVGGGRGHFIAILEKDGENYVTGDPLVGRQVFPASEIQKAFNFTGFFMEIRPAGK